MANITVIGGGSSAYTVIALLSGAAHRISLLTSKPERWKKEINCEVYLSQTSSARKITGTLHHASSNPAEVIPTADIIIVCGPVSSYRSIVSSIAPHIDKNKKTYLGTVYGQGGFNWICESLKKNTDNENLEYWAIGLLPWICRTKIYGETGLNYGAKTRNIIATSSPEAYSFLQKEILKTLTTDYFGCGEFHRASSFLSLTLSVDNQIIHPARCYGLWHSAKSGWEHEASVPYFYRDFDDFSAEVLQSLDFDYSQIREKIKSNSDKSYSLMLNYMDLEKFSYDSEHSNIKDSFTNSSTLYSIKPPTVKIGDALLLDSKHRFFTDDIFYGLDIARWFAARLSVPTPTIEMVRQWAIEAMKAQGVSLDGHDGTPSSFIDLDEKSFFD